MLLLWPHSCCCKSIASANSYRYLYIYCLPLLQVSSSAFSGSKASVRASNQTRKANRAAAAAIPRGRNAAASQELPRRAGAPSLARGDRLQAAAARSVFVVRAAAAAQDDVQVEEISNENAHISLKVTVSAEFCKASWDGVLAVGPEPSYISLRASSSPPCCHLLPCWRLRMGSSRCLLICFNTHRSMLSGCNEAVSGPRVPQGAPRSPNRSSSDSSEARRRSSSWHLSVPSAIPSPRLLPASRPRRSRTASASRAAPRSSSTALKSRNLSFTKFGVDLPARVEFSSPYKYVFKPDSPVTY